MSYDSLMVSFIVSKLLTDLLRAFYIDSIGKIKLSFSFLLNVYYYRPENIYNVHMVAFNLSTSNVLSVSPPPKNKSILRNYL